MLEFQYLRLGNPSTLKFQEHVYYAVKCGYALSTRTNRTDKFRHKDFRILETGAILFWTTLYNETPTQYGDYLNRNHASNAPNIY